MDASVIPDLIPRYSHQQIKQVITGIILCILLAALDQTVVIPAVPAIAADLNGFGHLSWIVTAYLLTSTAATPIYGRLSDSYGRRALLLPAIVLFIAASVLCALAGSLTQLIAFRALQGIGGAGLVSMAQAAIADVVSPRERGRYQGYMASMWGIASIAGPVVGGAMTDHLSWRFVFWINLPIGLCALWLSDRGLRLLPVRRQKAQIDIVGAALLIGGIIAWLLLLSGGGVEFPWRSAPAAGLALGGTALVVLLGFYERRHANPLLPPRLFASSVFVGGVTLSFLTSLGLFAATFLLPLLFQLVRGVDASLSGLMVMPYLVANVGGAYTAGSLARRLGRTKGIVCTGLSACALSFALLALLPAGTPAPALLLVTALLGAGIGSTMPSVLVQVQNAAERRDVGIATGTLLFLRSMGGAFGSTIAGALLAGRFGARLAALGVHRRIDLGEMRRGADALAGFSPALRRAATEALASGFHLAFGICGAILAVAVVVALLTRNEPLRSAGEAGQPNLGH